MERLNEQPSSVFTNEIFESTETESHMKLEKALFNDDERTLGVWKRVEPTNNVAVSIRYKVSDLDKLMPSFVDQLNVPLVVISEAVGKRVVYMRDKSKGCHFNNAWEFTDDGQWRLKKDYYNEDRNTSMSTEIDDKFCAEEQDYDYTAGVRGEPEADPQDWIDISISHDCKKSDPEQDQFCALTDHANMTDLNYAVPDTGEVYHIVQSCMPITINVTDCHQNGIMRIAVAQRGYKQSEFTHNTNMQIQEDVTGYYGFIVLIFIIVQIFLFFTLWSWLKSRVTNRMVELTKKINTNEQLEDRNRAIEYEKQPGMHQSAAGAFDLQRGSVRTSARSTRSGSASDTGDSPRRSSLKLGRLSFSRDTVANAVDTVFFDQKQNDNEDKD